MYRLRNLVGHTDHHRNRYREILRWRFTKENFNVRRTQVLSSLGTESNELSHSEILQRIVNTLAFINNSTVALPENLDENSIVYIQDVKTPQRIETQITTTILEMQYQKPDDIKYDLSYSWVKDVKQKYDEIEFHKKQKKPSSDIGLIGFYDYEVNLMVLNEVYSFCL